MVWLSLSITASFYFDTIILFDNLMQASVDKIAIHEINKVQNKDNRERKVI